MSRVKVIIRKVNSKGTMLKIYPWIIHGSIMDKGWFDNEVESL